MKKVILFSRVSTQRQTLDQQTNELINEAKTMGYTDWAIIEDKESAICLDEYERHGLNELKRLISTQLYDCVICYEISRISRRPKVLYSIRDLLIEKNIQLVILKPYMRLLDSDGKMSQTASIMFSLFSSLSESEMMIKKERMLRGKKIKKEQGYFIGGGCPFGYTIKNKRAYINEDEAKIIIDVYKRATKQNPAQITQDYYELGIFNDFTKQETSRKINRILRSKNYVGNNVYPKIIDDDTFYIVKKRLGPTKTKHSTRYKREEPLCKDIIICTDTNLMMRINTHNNVYFSRLNDIEKAERKGINIHYFSISINIVDSLVWSLVKDIEKISNTEDKEELKQRIDDIRKKILNCDIQKKRYLSQIDKIEERIIMGRLSDIKGDKMENDIKIKMDDITERKREYECSLSELIIRYSSFDMIELEDKEPTWQQMRDLVLRYTKLIEFKRMSNNVIGIDIHLYDDELYRYTIYKNGKGDYCVLDYAKRTVDFELLNKWRSNTLNKVLLKQEK